MNQLAMAALAVPASCAVAPSCFCSPLSSGLATYRVSVSIGPPTVKLARLIWNEQRSCKQRTKASLNVVAAKVDIQTEEEAAPAVLTESVPRPKKIGKGIVRLRLSRLGRKKRPFYRIVATHSTWRRDGKYIELLGHYNPLHAKDDLGVVVKADRIKYWLGVGAQPSDTVTGILYKVGILKAEEIPV